MAVVVGDTMSDIACFVRHGLVAVCLLALPVFAAAQPAVRELRGRVIDEAGRGLAGATVVASGTGFNGWAGTGSDGSFHVKAAGLFVSVRHAGRKALLLKTSELTEPVLIKMEPAGELKQLPVCGSSADAGTWIGGGLKLDAGRSSVDGPVSGQHDTHWYVKLGKDTLHIVDGYVWHAGLPREELLVQSETISVRSWESMSGVGLDLSGRSKNGRLWRWLGAPLAVAMEYNDVAPAAAAHFDRLMESACLKSYAPVAK